MEENGRLGGISREHVSSYFVRNSSQKIVLLYNYMFCVKED